MCLLASMLFFVLFTAGNVFAGELKVSRVVDGVYAIVGSLGQRSPGNLANNATFGLVVTKDGAVLIDAGGSYKRAATLDALIKTITKQPVKIVINTGGQDHHWIGNSYWKEKGARIIASKSAVADHKDRGAQQMTDPFREVAEKIRHKSVVHRVAQDQCTR